MERERAVYIHIPFCISKCHYCDFNSYPGMREMFDSYTDALRTEIGTAADRETQAATLYIGGGTPTVMSDQQIYSMVEAARIALSLPDSAETTIEANPATVEQGKLEGLMTAGVNRISFGVQSFDDELLKQIGRRHTAEEARQAVIDARLVGFGNISLDLIYALPTQTLAGWRDTLRQAVNLGPEHISLYELTIEQGTPFADLLAQGELPLPGEELQIEMYAAAETMLEAAGYERYEISSFAMPGFRSQHNQFYWRNQEYWGFGAGAVSYIDGRRTKNVSGPNDYIRMIEETGSAIESSEELSPEARLGETMMLGLRMVEGVDCEDLRQRFGVDVRRAYKSELDRLTGQGLLETCGSHIRLTHRGTLLANEVMAEFVRPDTETASVS
jgi:oxygen-independent coproporphyrinogen III oxidase